MLLGQLAGDALGAFVEFSSAEAIRARHPEGHRDLRPGGYWGTLAGQPTDDSEMALALARSILAAGRYDPAEAGQAYVAWRDSGPFDIGGNQQDFAAGDSPFTGGSAWDAIAHFANASDTCGVGDGLHGLDFRGAASAYAAYPYPRAFASLVTSGNVERARQFETQMAAAFQDARLVKVAVDQVHVPPTASIVGAREVAFFPPVTGG